MAERLARGGELAVEELKRKGRRRLVGAIVLALAAAIIVPMLLEDEPRPLGDDIAVQIPARDASKFVNRLSGGPPDAKAPPALPPEAAGLKPSLAEAEQRVLAAGAKPAAKAGSAQGVVDPKRESEPRPAVETVPAAPAAAPAAPNTAPAAPTLIAPAPPESAPPAAATPATETAAPSAKEFVVQLAAFADDKGANALANKLKRANYAAYVEPVSTSRGTLWRVRVGGYTSRPDADAARAKLKDEGYSGIVAPAK